MDTALVRHSRPPPAASTARRTGRVVIVGATAVALVTAGTVVMRSTSTAPHPPTVMVSLDTGGSSVWTFFPFHLFPPRPHSSPAGGYLSYAAMRRGRLAHAHPQPAEDIGSVASDIPTIPPENAVAAAPPPASEIPTAAPPPPVEATTEPAAPEPIVVPLAGTAPEAAPSPGAESKPATAAVFIPEMPQLKPQARPMSLGAVILVSGVLTTAPAASGSATEVEVGEVEAPVVLAPKSAPDKSPAAHKADPGTKRSHVVEIQPLPAGPLIPPAANLVGGPPPAREPLSLDTSLAPLAPSSSGEGPAPSGTATGADTDGLPSTSGAAPPSSRPQDSDSSILAARAATPPSASSDGSAKQPIAFSRLVFEVNAIDLPKGAARDLEAIVSAAADSHLRVRLSAYASGDADGGNQARRMSLSRALAVRSYLIQQGIAGEQLEVRALGNRSAGAPEDRVDLSVGDR